MSLLIYLCKPKRGRRVLEVWLQHQQSKHWHVIQFVRALDGTYCRQLSGVGRCVAVPRGRTGTSHCTYCLRSSKRRHRDSPSSPHTRYCRRQRGNFIVKAIIICIIQKTVRGMCSKRVQDVKETFIKQLLHTNTQSHTHTLSALTQSSDKSQRKWQPPSTCSGLSREVRWRRLSRSSQTERPPEATVTLSFRNQLEVNQNRLKPASR